MNALHDRREAYKKAAGSYFETAAVHASEGDLEAAGELILKALDQERRAGGVGPQVLQLIKPRH